MGAQFLGSPLVSILIPVIRPEKAKRCIEAIVQNADTSYAKEPWAIWIIDGISVEIISAEDKERIGCPKMVKKLADQARGEWLCFLGDDTIPQEGWLKAALEAGWERLSGPGLVGLADGTGRALPTHWLAHRDFVATLENQEPFFTGYTHCFSDNELWDIAREQCQYVKAWDAKIKHDHPMVKGETVQDPDLKRVYDRDVYWADQILYWRRKRARAGFRLGIGLPVIDEKVFTDFFLSFITMVKGDCTLYVPKYPGGEFPHDIAAARNDIALQALRDGCTHLAMMDTDQIYSPDCLMRMLKAMEGWDILGARVHKRWPPYDAPMMRGTVGKFKHVPDAQCFSGEVVEVDATGTGCILIDTEVFLDLPWPWFELKHTPDGKPVGEDIGFCAKVRQLWKPGSPRAQSWVDRKIAVDTSLEVGHIGRHTITREYYEVFKRLNNVRWAP